MVPNPVTTRVLRKKVPTEDEETMESKHKIVSDTSDEGSIFVVSTCDNTTIGETVGRYTRHYGLQSLLCLSCTR